MAAARYPCPYCGQTFAAMSDKLVHAMLDHAGAPRLIRPVSCWRCAREMTVVPGEPITCQCGFTLPAR